KGMIIEHINGNQEDNRLENLRLVNRIRAGRRLQKNNTSGVSGVHFARLINKWEAWFGGKYLGVFDDFTSAVEARRKREKSFIDQGEKGAGGNSHA
ncbi:HNH endonuclease, partial [Salmonella enterica]|nr:HNH endonuclease [Salmonella enterica]EJX3286913.1 HNH endonuclease [Salmonella enterica]